MALIDSKTLPAEFGFKYRDWILRHDKEDNTAFAVLDLNYIDGSNQELAQSFGFSVNEAPTIFALERPSTGNYFKQNKKFNLTNFDEISEGFKQGVEANKYSLYASQWRYYYLNIMNRGYLSSLWKALKSLINSKTD